MFQAAGRLGSVAPASPACSTRSLTMLPWTAAIACDAGADRGDARPPRARCPLVEHYLSFLWNALTFDFGKSFVNSVGGGNGRARTTLHVELGDRLDAAGRDRYSAKRRGGDAPGKTTDCVTRLFSLAGFRHPRFIYLGALLLITFSLNLGWLTINGGRAVFRHRMYHVNSCRRSRSPPIKAAFSPAVSRPRCWKS